MFTRMLKALGVELGAQLQGPAPDNPRGFWEHRLFQAVNMSLLKNMGCDRDGLDEPERLLAAAGRVAQQAEVLAPHLEKTLRKAFVGGTWAFKDPRTAVTYGFWSQLLPRLGLNDIRPIVLVRGPVGCTRSLLARGDLQLRLGGSAVCLRLWSTYYRLLAESVPEDALWLAHADLVDPELSSQALTRVVEYLGLGDAQALVGPAQALFFRKLLHHGGSRDEGESSGVAAVDAQYQHLLARTRAADPPAPARLRSDFAGGKDGYCIWVVSPPGYVHSQAFAEVALALHHALAELGYRAPIVYEPFELVGTPIVLGAQLLVGQGARAQGPECLPPNAILYNLEQVYVGSAWFSEVYLDLLRRFAVWDYSEQNLERLAELGVRKAQLCPVGYHSALRRVAQLPEAQRDVDVLFYGSANERRLKVLQGLTAAGLNVVQLFGVYGAARDQWIARSKLVLNLHYYPARVLEIVRISYLLANGVCVVSERPPLAVGPLEQGLCLADYEDLVPACVRLVGDAAERQALAERGQALFGKERLVGPLQALLEPDRSASMQAERIA